MIVILTGAPGSGKGTQAEMLKKQLNVPHLSTGEMLREASKHDLTPLGDEIRSNLDSGSLVSDELITQLVISRLSSDECKNGVILDGFPRTVEQAKALDLYLSEQNKPIKAIVNIEVPKEELIKRLMSRGRDDDTIDVIGNRLEIYNNTTKKVFDYYKENGLPIHNINGTYDKAVVLRTITNSLGLEQNRHP